MALSRVTRNGWVEESGALSSVTRAGWVQESQTSGATDATAPGATLTATSTLIPGAASASGGGDATAPGATLTATSSLTPGAATGGTSITGSFHFDACENNTGSGVIDAAAVNWTWISGAVGGATAINNGVGTMTTAGMTVSGLPVGPGFGLIKTTDGLVVAYQEGTVT